MVPLLLAVDTLTLFVIIAMSILGVVLCIGIIACIVVYNRYAATTAPPPSVLKAQPMPQQPGQNGAGPPPGAYPPYGYYPYGPYGPPPPGPYGYPYGPPQGHPQQGPPHPMHGGLVQEPAPMTQGAVSPAKANHTAGADPTISYSHAHQQVSAHGAYGGQDDVAAAVAAAS